MRRDDIKVGDIWTDELGNQYEVKRIDGTVVVSESIGDVVEPPE